MEIKIEIPEEEIRDALERKVRVAICSGDDLRHLEGRGRNLAIDRPTCAGSAHSLDWWEREVSVCSPAMAQN